MSREAPRQERGRTWTSHLSVPTSTAYPYHTPRVRGFWNGYARSVPSSETASLTSEACASQNCARCISRTSTRDAAVVAPMNPVASSCILAFTCARNLSLLTKLFGCMCMHAELLEAHAGLIHKGPTNTRASLRTLFPRIRQKRSAPLTFAVDHGLPRSITCRVQWRPQLERLRDVSFSGLTDRSRRHVRALHIVYLDLPLVGMVHIRLTFRQRAQPWIHRGQRRSRQLRMLVRLPTSVRLVPTLTMNIGQCWLVRIGLLRYPKPACMHGPGR
ncbi:hypothetical protein PENSPDRAFT_455740 [Peniophora sp. CONT]|nr:hypothetical protein PENSPDRAFT_455740 [Peniophora sp. CONT]